MITKMIKQLCNTFCDIPQIKNVFTFPLNNSNLLKNVPMLWE